MAKVVEETRSPFDETPSPFQRAMEMGLVGVKDTPVADIPIVERTTEKRVGRPTVDDELLWIPKFLDALAEGLSITDACKAARVHPTLVYGRRRKNVEFRKQWNECAHIGTALLEQEAQRRAFHGTLKPVFHKGVECGTIREYSDTLLGILLRARKPEVYRENTGGGGHGGQITVNIFERVAILRQQLEHGDGQPTAILDAGIQASTLLGDSRREPLDKAHADGQTNGLSSPG